MQEIGLRPLCHTRLRRQHRRHRSSYRLYALSVSGIRLRSSCKSQPLLWHSSPSKRNSARPASAAHCTPPQPPGSLPHMQPESYRLQPASQHNAPRRSRPRWNRRLLQCCPAHASGRHFPRGCGALRAAHYRYLGEPARRLRVHRRRLCPRSDRRPCSAHCGRRPHGPHAATTIVDLTLGEGRWKILREGTISTQKIVAVMHR
jgi:hypothetical protein